MVDNRIPCHITGLYIFAVVNLCALLNISLVSADIFVMEEERNNTIIDTIEDKQASFGPDFPTDGLIGRLFYVQGYNACIPLSNPPLQPSPADYPWFLLIQRGSCFFDQKVFFAQSAGFMAAIVYNSEGDDGIITMPGERLYKDKIHIPSVFVGYTNGIDLAQKYTFNNLTRRLIKIREEEDYYDFGAYFIPFVIVVSITFLGIIIFSLIKCVQHCRHEQRNKLSKRALKNIPTRKYKKGDHYDVCAICLDEYEEGEKLRVLPCDHTYHSKCIDPWLTERRKTCPQCKRRVVPKQNPESESDEEETDGEGASENTPLLASSSNAGPAQSSRSGSLGRTRVSTFERSGLPAAVQPEVVIISGAQSSSEDEETLEDVECDHGAVGGMAAINTQHTSQKVINTLPVMSEAERTGTLAGEGATSETDTLLSPQSDHSPARLDGSINATFTSSTSGEEEGAPSGRKSKKKKRRNNVV